MKNVFVVLVDIPILKISAGIGLCYSNNSWIYVIGTEVTMGHTM
jgi:hypothetical protein